MVTRFLLYGANGFVGEAIARLAVQQGLQPTLAGRDAAKIERLAAELAASRCVFGLDDAAKTDRALADMPVCSVPLRRPVCVHVPADGGGLPAHRGPITWT